MQSQHLWGFSHVKLFSLQKHSPKWFLASCLPEWLFCWILREAVPPREKTGSLPSDITNVYDLLSLAGSRAQSVQYIGLLLFFLHRFSHYIRHYLTLSHLKQMLATNVKTPKMANSNMKKIKQQKSLFVLIPLITSVTSTGCFHPEKDSLLLFKAHI